MAGNDDDDGEQIEGDVGSFFCYFTAKDDVHDVGMTLID
jgi:hypothetical protein